MIYTYLSSDGEENFALKIHEIDFVATLLVIVIHTINDFAIRIEDRAAIAMEHK